MAAAEPWRDTASWSQDDAQVRDRWRQATSSVVSAMLGGQRPDEYLRVVAGAAVELVDADLATIAVPWIPGQSLRLRVAAGAHAEDLAGAVFPVDESLSGEVLRTRRPLRVPDATANGTSYQPVCELGDMGPTLVAPLIVRQEAVGTLLVSRRRGGPTFDERDLAMLESFSDHAALASELGDARAQVARLAVVEERERIGRELHDTVVQHLFAIGLELQTSVAGCTPPAAERVEQSVDRLNEVISVIRGSILELAPAGVTSSPRTSRIPA